MRINSIQNNYTSFSAKTVRECNSKREERSKTQILQSYDDQIDIIKKQKQRAIELDEYMHSKEIKKILKQLPAKDFVEINHMFAGDTGSVEGKDGDYVIPCSHMICYYHKSNEENEKFQELYDSRGGDLHIDIQKRDGSIDKKLIKNYLKSLIEIFKD